LSLPALDGDRQDRGGRGKREVEQVVTETYPGFLLLLDAVVLDQQQCALGDVFCGGHGHS
jgi:hypothetical protein